MALRNQAVDYKSYLTENQSLFTKQWFKLVSLTKWLISEQNQRYQTTSDNHSSVLSSKRDNHHCANGRNICVLKAI